MEKLNLENLTDNELVRRINDVACSESIRELTSRHQPLVAHVVKRYAMSVRATGTCLNDFLEQTPSLIFEAAKDFNEDKNTKFSTWLANKVRFSCLKEINSNNSYYNGESEELTDYLINTTPTPPTHDEMDEEKLEYVKNILSQVKDQRIRTIIQMRYLSGSGTKQSFVKIAKRLNMSIEGVRLLHNSFIKFVSEKIASGHDFDKI